MTDETKSIRYGLRLSVEEYQLLLRAADKAERNLADYIRRTVLREAREQVGETDTCRK